MARVTLRTEETYGLKTEAQMNTTRRKWRFSKDYRTQRFVAVSMATGLISPQLRSYHTKKDVAY
jgi:hypothetical protein